MSGIRNSIERWFQILAQTIVDHRFKTLFIMAILFAAFAVQLPKIKVDTSTEGFLHNDDPALAIYEKFRDQFGRDEMVIIALKPEKVFDTGFLKELKALHIDLHDNTPFLEDITSLVNARDTRGENDELIVEDLLEHFPETEEELSAVKKRALGNVMYENMLLSEDGRFTTIIIQTRSYSEANSTSADLDEFSDDDFNGDEQPQGTNEINAGKEYLTDAENSQVVKAVETIVGKHNFKNTQVFIAGSPVVTDFLKRTMLSDTAKFMKIVVITIALFLLVLFRRISGVLVPLIVVVLSLVTTVGLMAASGVALKLPTQILPSLSLQWGWRIPSISLSFSFAILINSGIKKKPSPMRLVIPALQCS